MYEHGYNTQIYAYTNTDPLPMNACLVIAFVIVMFSLHLRLHARRCKEEMKTNFDVSYLPADPSH